MDKIVEILASDGITLYKGPAPKQITLNDFHEFDNATERKGNIESC
jgi:hypothetical protein